MPRMLRLAAVAVLAVAASTLVASPASADATGNLLYTPAGDNEKNNYVRVIRLQHSGADNGRLLATFEHEVIDEPSEFIIRSSDDDGRTWTTLATVPDAEPGPGHPVSRMWQPSLFEFPTQVGAYPAGSLLLVGNTVPADGSFTEFYAWRSSDHGRTWQPQGVIQRGGTFGHGIWEPHLALDNRGRLVMFFSDERDAPTHSQMIVHVTSSDGGRTWSPVVRDVASAVPADRPGMPVVTRMGDGAYALTFEVCGRMHCESHIKLSHRLDNWGDPADIGPAIVSTDGRYPGGSPYVTWVPAGGPHGELIVAAKNVYTEDGDQPTAEGYRSVFVNDDYGRGPWHWATGPWRASDASPDCKVNYSPNLLPEDPEHGVVRYSANTSVGSSGPCGEATGVAPIGVLPFHDQFASLGQAGWSDYGGCWRVEGDTYLETCGGNQGNKALTGSTGWSDYTVSAQLRITPAADGRGSAGLLARVSDPAVGPDAHRGYLAFLDVKSDRLVLAREQYRYEQLGSAPVPGGVAADTWYALTFSAVGDELTATAVPADGGTPVTVRFTDPYSSFPRGMIGLRDWIGTAGFRDVGVVRAGKQHG